MTGAVVVLDGNGAATTRPDEHDRMHKVLICKIMPLSIFISPAWTVYGERTEGEASRVQTGRRAPRGGVLVRHIGVARDHAAAIAAQGPTACAALLRPRAPARREINGRAPLDDQQAHNTDSARAGRTPRKFDASGRAPVASSWRAADFSPRTASPTQPREPTPLGHGMVNDHSHRPGRVALRDLVVVCPDLSSGVFYCNGLGILSERSIAIM